MRSLFFLVFSVVFFGVVLTAQDDGIDPKELGRNMADYVGQEVSFTDELAYIYRDVTEYEGYMKFDTRFVSCRIKVREEDDKKLLLRYAMGELRTLKDVHFKDSRLELIREILYNEIEPHPVRITGDVTAPSIYEGMVHIVDVSEVERVRYKR